MIPATWKLSEIRELCLELTNACNAACPQCGRNVFGSSRVTTPVSWSVDNFSSWFNSDFIKQLDRVLFCGNQGDPILCKDLLPIIQHIVSINPSIKLIIATNGGVRDLKFWNDLGSLFGQQPHKESRVIFGIDGLDDTNHLYRRNVDWNRLMSNVVAFIGAGGYAKWQFILFKHNEHQVDAAKELANNLGFVEFMTLNSAGFDDTNYMPVYSKSGDVVYSLEPASINRLDIVESPSNIKFDNYNEFVHYMRTNVTPEVPLTEETFIADAEVQKLKDRQVRCKATATNSIFVNAKGMAGPCSFIHASLDMTPMSTVDFQLRRRNESLGLDAFNLRATSLDKIIENLNTIYALPQSIGLDGKVMYCATICSVSSKIDVLYRDNERL